MADDLAERAAIVAMLHAGGISWSQLASDILDAGSAVQLHRQRPAQQDLFSSGADPLAPATRDLQGWLDAGIGVHGVSDESYPALLRDIRERPPILFTRGRITEDARAIAIVGSRNATDRGRHIAHTVATELTRQGVTVVSGLARGIDAAAHRAALAVGGRTVAVIGTGINQVYPTEHRDLQREIAEHGLVLSQFWPDAPPRRENFPMRNAVMSGYSAATVVVEAGEHSGVRIQTRLALEHGRQVILLADLLNLTWARALAKRPGVTVVATPEDLFAAVDAVLEQRTRQLAPAEDFADVVFA